MNEQEIEQKQDMTDDHLPSWLKKATAPISFKIVFQGIPEVCESQTFEIKIPRSQNPKEPGLSITYEEYPLLAEAIKEEMSKFNDWNDVSNTKIPLNEKIFALLQDRMDPEKLRPEVIIAHMHPAKRLLWTEQTEGDVLCYDVPSGNYHCCNGAQIKYWKYVNAPR